MPEFQVDNGDYERWSAGNQDQYVVDAQRSLNPSTPTRGSTWMGEYIKIGGARQEPERAYPDVRPCGTCL